MKIEAGKYYVTRDGRKVGPMTECGSDDGLAGGVVGDKNRVFRIDDGSHYYEETNLDLVSELIQPAIAIELDKTYVTRDGHTIGPMQPSAGKGWQDDNFPFCNGSASERSTDGAPISAWTASGKYSRASSHPLDIIAEVPAPVVATDGNAPHIVAVVINGKPAPAIKPFVHSGYSAARVEALRLAGRNPGSEFAIYQRVGGVVVEVVIKDAA